MQWTAFARSANLHIHPLQQFPQKLGASSQLHETMIWLQQLANPIPLVFEATFHFAFKIILLRSLLRIWLFADSLLVYSIVTSICYNEGISCRYSVPKFYYS